jgi:hypothetical protein
MSRTITINGLPIANARQPLALHITAKDVKTAKIKRPDYCVVAQALKREQHALEVRVHLGRVYVRTTPNEWTRYITPGSLRNEIIAFDRGGTFATGVHTLGGFGPVKLAKSGKTQGTRPPKKKTKKAAKRGPYHMVTDVRTGPVYA